MKTLKNNWANLAWAVTLAGTVMVAVYASISAWGQTGPGLSISLTGTNTVSLTVTNALPAGIYEIYFQEFLDGSPFTNGSWSLVGNGSAGQSNFNLILGNTDTGFFRAVNGNDFDNDGVPNYEDARPFDPTVGILIMTIETPANGSVVN
jgi:hypothetical protein